MTRVKCFSQACEYDSKDEFYQSKLKEKSEQLTPQQASRVQELLREAQAGEYAQGHLLGDLAGPGKGEASLDKQRIHQLDFSATFAEANRASLTAEVREELRSCFARHFSCKSPLDAQLSSIKFQPSQGLTIEMEIHLRGSNPDAEAALAAATVFAEKLSTSQLDWADTIYGVLDGGEAERQLGREVVRASATLKDITAALQAQHQAEDFEFSSMLGQDSSGGQGDSPSRPKTQIELPYKMYALVHADGSPCERKDKHGFAMSRVYYSKTELPDEVYVQLCDSSLRWRQSSDEIKIILLRVPPQLRASRDLDVQILPESIKCANRKTGEAYFDGRLCRGIIPEQSLWEYDSDTGAVTLYLKKMNLELLSK